VRIARLSGLRPFTRFTTSVVSDFHSLLFLL
jgi:hypothetical protein